MTPHPTGDDHDDYMERLADRLRSAGMPAAQVEATLAELDAHLSESGTDPGSEFGPPEEFADGLTGAPPAADGGERADGTTAQDGDDPHTLRVYSNALEMRDNCDRLGAEGWEAQDMDSNGLITFTRDPDEPQRWEYRFEYALTSARQERRSGELAPDGWEPAVPFGGYAMLYKRPRAVEEGPGARIDAPAPRPTRRFLWGPRFYLGMGVFLAVMYGLVYLLAAGTELLLGGPPEGLVKGFFQGTETALLAGLAVAAVMAVVQAVRTRRDRPAHSPAQK
ncbi:hypothetical protein O4J56_31850 [Nocardiopsis sp. RSe5-2]|uniref:DUF1707 domain-containing protein n=1 Tax=Nocardiopsis endophytica TaxID=3018445 RepID=A0ABT4UE58_9ACTN|nr:hypothetical protein [Nocardiopsis endophytica]MDA2815279.1 hypothetical protein [Nocardiopsis endophytica]